MVPIAHRNRRRSRRPKADTRRTRLARVVVAIVVAIFVDWHRCLDHCPDLRQTMIATTIAPQTGPKLPGAGGFRSTCATAAATAGLTGSSLASPKNSQTFVIFCHGSLPAPPARNCRRPRLDGWRGPSLTPTTNSLAFVPFDAILRGLRGAFSKYCGFSSG